MSERSTERAQVRVSVRMKGIEVSETVSVKGASARSRVRASVLGSCWTKVHDTVAKARLIMPKSPQSWTTFRRCDPENVHESVARAQVATLVVLHAGMQLAVACQCCCTDDVAQGTRE